MWKLVIGCAATLALNSPGLGQTPLEDAVATARRHSEAVDQVLLSFKDSHDLNAWAVVIWTLMKEEPWVTLRTVEDKLRRLGIEVYLVARPTDEPGVPVGACARLPHDLTCRPYSIWVIVGDRDEARRKMQAYGADEAANLERLTRAGILITARSRAI